jgi:alpha-L-fucosidase
VVSRGGNLLLDVGPTAEGEIPELQRRTLDQLADWMQVNSPAIHGARPLPAQIAAPSDAPWVRWTRTGATAYAIIDARGEVRLRLGAGGVDAASAALIDGTPLAAGEDGSELVLDLPGPTVAGPAVVRFTVRG